MMQRFFQASCIVVVLMGILFWTPGCGLRPPALQATDLRSGDLLFTGPGLWGGDKLSTAIDEVTKTDMETSYTHMGMVEVRDSVVWVWHAAPEVGVSCESLERFLKRRHRADVYRLDDTLMSYVPAALDSARRFNGLPYDDAYLMDGRGHYCSGFVYTLFRSANIFELEAMTFKDPETGSYHPFWRAHYARLGVDIPEGLPGCNPNGMALSPHLRFVGKVLDK